MNRRVGSLEEQFRSDFSPGKDEKMSKFSKSTEETTSRPAAITTQHSRTYFLLSTFTLHDDKEILHRFIIISKPITSGNQQKNYFNDKCAGFKVKVDSVSLYALVFKGIQN